MQVSSSLLTRAFRMMIAHHPVLPFSYVSCHASPDLFLYIFPFCGLTCAYVWDNALRRRTNHPRQVLEGKENKWFLYLIFLKKKPSTETQLKAHWLRRNCADFQPRVWIQKDGLSFTPYPLTSLVSNSADRFLFTKTLGKFDMLLCGTFFSLRNNNCFMSRNFPC